MKCHWCGASIPDEAKVCPHCGARLKRDATRCPYCNEKIRAGLSLCPYCGYELGRRRVSWWIVAGVGGAVLAIAALALFFLPLNLPSFSVPTIVSMASPTPTEILLTPTATLEPTPTPTKAPPTPVPPTSTATATPTGTALPTATPTLAPPTSTPTPTATETSAFKYGAPRLSEPPDDLLGNYPIGGGDHVWLKWEPVGPLAEDEFYGVSVRIVRPGGETDYCAEWVKDPTWHVPREECYDKADRGHPFQWDVTVVRKIVNPDGTTGGENISPTSETWTFYWR